ncbi:MAG: hypothetical protein J6A25_06610 [Lachnospiraceae bacterium]|nr:hypothetical protein [Lachnospiraceae bacterium]
MDKDKELTINENGEFEIEIPIEELKQERAGGTTIYWSSKYAGSSSIDAYNLRVGVQWSSTAGTGGSNVYARTILGSAKISASNKNATITINGTSKTASFSPSYSGSTYQEKTAVENTVWVGYYGSKSIIIKGTIDINITYSGTKVTTMEKSVTATLDQVPVPAPTNVTLEGGPFANGCTHTIRWTQVSGMSYEIFVSYCKTDGSWTDWDWHSTPGATSSGTVSHGWNSNNYRDIQIGVRATAGGVNSGVVGTGSQMRRGSRVLYSNGSWGHPVVKVYHNNAWHNAYVRVYLDGVWRFI